MTVSPFSVVENLGEEICDFNNFAGQRLLSYSVKINLKALRLDMSPVVKLALIMIIFSLQTSIAHSATSVATCSGVKGYSYYAESQFVKKESSGWDKDGITGSVFSLKKLENNRYDILVLDASKNIASSIQDGAIVSLIRKNKLEAAFLVYYPNSTVEIYTFSRDSGGKDMISMLQTKGHGSFMPKISAFVGECEFINFEAVTPPLK